MQNIIENFQAAGLEYGLEIPADLTPGKIKRFSDGTGKNKNGWAIFYDNGDGSAGGAFGNWKGIEEKWFYSPKGKNISEEDKKRFAQQMEKARAEELKNRLAKQKAAAQNAQDKWDNANPADPMHPYLKAKKIHPDGIKQIDEKLIIPLMDESGKICSIQTVNPDGRKKFLKDGRTKGCFYVLGGSESSGSIYITEGFATGATVHAVVQVPVVVAFNTGNLEIVSRIIREKYPDKNIIIAADNDLATEEKTGKNPGREAAIKAASTIKAEITLSPVNSDFNDLYCQCDDEAEAIESVKEALSAEFKIDNGINSEWEAPIPFDVIDLPDINPDIFPLPIGEMIKAVAIETETPVSLAAGIALAAIATACQGKIILKVKQGYIEPLNLWIIIILDSATRKSSVMSKEISPLVEWEKKKAVALEDAIKFAKSRRKLQEARLKALRARHAKAKRIDLPDLEEQITELENNLIQVPKVPRLWAQDVTPEKLGMLLSEHNERMSNFSAEGGIFSTIGGRYSNNVSNLDIFLQTHAGDPVRVDRAGRGPIFLNNPTFTFGLATQPSVLWEIVSKEDFRGSGFLARFLYLIPESTVGYRTFETDPVPLGTENAYHSRIEALLNIEPNVEDDDEVPYTIELSDDAFKVHLEFSKWVEIQLRPNGRFAHMKDWAGKLAGAAARIAGLFHCAENPDQPWERKVSKETMEKALELASIFSIHAHKVFNSSEADSTIKQAMRVLKWLQETNAPMFTQKECFDKFKGTFKKVKDLEPILNLLVEHHYIKNCASIEEKKPGRPSKTFDVNPIIMGQN